MAPSEREEKMLHEQKMCASSEVAAQGLAQSLKSSGLRQRIRVGAARAQNQAQKLVAYNELEYLLDKHPEIARILDLIEEVR